MMACKKPRRGRITICQPLKSAAIPNPIIHGTSGKARTLVIKPNTVTCPNAQAAYGVVIAVAPIVDARMERILFHEILDASAPSINGDQTSNPHIAKNERAKLASNNKAHGCQATNTAADSRSRRDARGMRPTMGASPTSHPIIAARTTDAVGFTNSTNVKRKNDVTANACRRRRRQKRKKGMTIITSIVTLAPDTATRWRRPARRKRSFNVFEKARSP